jgi:phytoene dehydrogenase-like protein
MRVVVIGGGLAGLVAARTLATAGCDVTLFERREAVGGRVRSTHDDGFVFDHGFQVLFTGYPAVERELDIDALDLRYFRPGACIARPGDRSRLADPVRAPDLFFESLFNREVTLADKWRTLGLRRDLGGRSPDAPFETPDDEDTSIRQYLAARGFSTAYIEHFAAPFYGGVTLDRSLSTSRRVFEATFAALSQGRIGVPADGMGAIPAQLAASARAASVEVRTDEAVTEVQHRDEGVHVEHAGETTTADAAVVATDPPTARELTGLDTIPTAGRGCVTQYYSLPTPELPVGPTLVLNAADERPNHVAPLSAVAPEYAPDGQCLLAATFLGRPDADDETLTEHTREALAGWFPAREFGRLELRHTEHIEFAQFDQPPGVHAGLPDVRDPDGPVYLAGEITRWSSIQGALQSGVDAAQAVEADLL